jgi:hypothetical protein
MSDVWIRRLTVWPGRWAVCRLAPDAAVPAWASRPTPLTVIARTDTELSIVAPEAVVPADGIVERGFRVLALEGPIPFTTTGVIAAVARPLADAGISLFPIATYDTDYIMVKEVDLDRAERVLRQAGWLVEGGSGRRPEIAPGRVSGPIR